MYIKTENGFMLLIFPFGFSIIAISVLFYLWGLINKFQFWSLFLSGGLLSCITIEIDKSKKGIQFEIS